MGLGDRTCGTWMLDAGSVAVRVGAKTARARARWPNPRRSPGQLPAVTEDTAPASCMARVQDFSDLLSDHPVRSWSDL